MKHISTTSIGDTGKVVLLELSNPDAKNALSLALIGELKEFLASEDWSSCAGLIITGGGGVFSAGADLKDITGTPIDVEYDDALAQVTQLIRSLVCPVAAVIVGPCMGAAFDLALSCDVVIAEEDAFFEVPAVKLGLLYSPQSIRRLAGVLPTATVRRLLILGERFKAQSAVRAGIASDVVVKGKGVATASLLMERTYSEQSKKARALTKKLITSLVNGEYDDRYWQCQRTELLGSPERKASVDAAKKLFVKR